MSETVEEVEIEGERRPPVEVEPRLGVQHRLRLLLPPGMGEGLTVAVELELRRGRGTPERRRGRGRRSLVSLTDLHVEGYPLPHPRLGRGRHNRLRIRGEGKRWGLCPSQLR